MTNPRTAYRQNDAGGASGVRLVILLYEQIIQDLSRAAKAVEHCDIELRTNCINHAILVIGYLQSPLDFGKGGKVAKDLDQFYNVLRQNLMQVQFFPSKIGVNQLITDALAVREAWSEVERAEAAVITRSVMVPAASMAAPSSISATPDSSSVRTKWEG